MTQQLVVCPDQSKNAKWRPDNSITRSHIPVELRPIVLSIGSLTTLLTELSDDSFRVQLIDLKKKKAFWHESRALRIQDNCLSIVREVNLIVHDVPVVYARSIIPIDFYAKRQNGISGLGNSPLGHLLFRDGRMRKSKREFAVIEDHRGGELIYARRTPYSYKGGVILVSEFFLPELKSVL